MASKNGNPKKNAKLQRRNQTKLKTPKKGAPRQGNPPSISKFHRGLHPEAREV